MAEIKGIAHFSIPVSDVDKSTRFYTEIVGCKFLSALPDKSITFLDAGGVCVLLITIAANANAMTKAAAIHEEVVIDLLFNRPYSSGRCADMLKFVAEFLCAPKRACHGD